MGKKVVRSYLKLTVDIFIVIFSVITFMCSFIPNVEPGLYPVFSTMALAMPFFLVFTFLGLIWLIFRKQFIFWIFPILAIAFNWGYVGGMFQFDKGHKEIAGSYSVMTLNTARFGLDMSGYKLKDVGDYTEYNAFDIVCLQEFVPFNEVPMRKFLEAFSHYQYALVPNDKRDQAPSTTAIFSQFPIIRWGKVTFNSNNTNEAIWADINIDEQIVRVINVHMQTTNVRRHRRFLSEAQNLNIDKDQALSLERDLGENYSKRAEQARLIKTIVDTTVIPVILCGDFNDTPNSYTYKTLLGDKLYDGFKSAGHGWGYTFNEFKRLLRIDYIFHSITITPVDYFSERKDWSDHNPVVMRFKM